MGTHVSRSKPNQISPLNSPRVCGGEGVKKKYNRFFFVFFFFFFLAVVAQVWEIAKKRLCHVFEGHEQEIYSLDFSNDGRYIVSGSGDKTMRIWDLSDKSCRMITIETTGPVHQDAAGVTSVSISPDGTMVAAGSLDSIIRIWEVTSGTLLDSLRGHRDSVYSVAFTPDGKGLVSGSLDKSLKLWDLSSLLYKLAARNRQDSPLTISGSSSSRPSSSSTSTPVMDYIGHKVSFFSFFFSSISE